MYIQRFCIVIEIKFYSILFYSRRTGQHPFGGQTEFCPNGEHKLFVMRPRQGEKNKNDLLQCLFVDGRRVVPNDNTIQPTQIHIV